MFELPHATHCLEWDSPSGTGNSMQTQVMTHTTQVTTHNTGDDTQHR